MAYPALWGTGALAVALVAAGIWLNHGAATDGGPAAPPPAPEPAAPPPAPEPAAADLLPPPRAASAPDRVDAAAPPAPEPAVADLLPPPRAAPTPDRVDAVVPEGAPDAEPAAGIRIDGPAEPTAGPDGDGQPDRIAAPGASARVPLPPAGDLTAYGGAPVWVLEPPAGYTDLQRRIIGAALTGLHGAAPYFGAAAFAPDSGDLAVVTGYAALAPAEAAALAQCEGACLVAARLVPEDFDGRRTDTLNAAQAEARDRLHQNAQRQGGQTLHHVLAWSDEGALGTGSLGNTDAARILAMIECRTAQGRITGAQDDAPPCRAALVAAPDPAAARP